MACLVWLLAATLPGLAQVVKLKELKDFKVPEYYPTDRTSPSTTNRLKSLLTGATARPQKDGTVELSEMSLQSFARNGETNLVATAPECRADTKNRFASSPGPITIQTGNGQLSIQGLGFHCQISNVVLVISNNVETTIHRELIHTSESAASRLALTGIPGPGLTNGLATNAPMRITSDRFIFNQESNQVVYHGRVRVDDPRMELTCEDLVITLTTNGSIDRIVADQDVVMIGKLSGSRAMGDRAIYEFRSAAEIVELLGQPARWTDGPREGEGEHYLFELRANHLKAPGPSLVRIPKADLSQPLFAGPTTTSKAAETTAEPASPVPPGATNEFIEVTAQFMDLQLEGTNNAGRTLLASNQVVMLSPADQSRATGERAYYEDATGIFALTGNAVWRAEDRLVEGAAFYFDRTNRTFQVRSNSHVRVPLTSLGENSMFSQTLQTTNAAGPAAPRFVEVFSEDLDYHADRLTFRQNVRLHLLESDRVVGRMSCAVLNLFMKSNRVETITAEHGVEMEQLPVLASNSNLVAKLLTCERFTVHVGTNGQVRQMIAETNVLIRQSEQKPAVPLPVHTDLKAEIVTAWFSTVTNDLDRIVAERNVVITQEQGMAKGDEAVYTRETDEMVLSGNVTLEAPTLITTVRSAVLRHFGLWPGRLSQLNVPLKTPGRPKRDASPAPPAKP